MSELSVQFAAPANIEADWLIVGVWEADGAAELPAPGAALQSMLARLREQGDVVGRANELTPLYGANGVAAARVLLVGLGKRAVAERATLTDAAATATRWIAGKQRSRVAFVLPEDFPNLNLAETALMAGVGLVRGCAGPGLRKSEPSRFAPDRLILVAPPSAPVEEVRAAVRRAAEEGAAVQLARELVNTPPCDLYPESFAQRARDEAAASHIECEVLDEERLEAERMGALLAVARGSERPPRLVVLRHRGGGSGPTLGLVGKGVTFDSGGLSLKTNDQMVDMKCDMAGAAAVLGAVTAIGRLQLPVNVLGVLALVENLPSGRSMKLGDVLHTRRGKTIEVLNTDAEGRLILADALAYAVDHHVSHLVDLATLTGACMIALGTEVAGLMTNNESWGETVRAASTRAGERAWPLPMFAHYGEMIKSQVADMKNTGGSRYGGAITAAKLLEQFVEPAPWVHLDIAGPAWVERETPSRDSGGTGCFVRTLVELAGSYPGQG